MTTLRAEPYRVQNPGLESRGNSNYGAFSIPFGSKNLRVICAPIDADWQHVSVSLGNRTPTWEEMCFIKDLFWEKDEMVVQYHPAEEDYVNNHKFCLHLWRLTSGEVPRPPKILV